MSSWPSFKFEDSGGEEQMDSTSPFPDLSITKTSSGSADFDLFDFDQLQANFSNLFPFAFLPLSNTQETTTPSDSLSPTDPHITSQPTTVSGEAVPIYYDEDDDDMVRLRFSSGEFSPEVDFRDPSSVSISSSRRSVSPAPSTRSTHTMSSQSSMSTLSTVASEREDPLATHLRNSRHAHAPLCTVELESYVEDEEPDTEEEEWRDDSESRRKRKRPSTGRTLFRKKTDSKRRVNQKKTPAVVPEQPERRRQRPKPPKREKKRRDWVGHPRAHEISTHIYNFLIQCRQRQQKPSAADIYKSNPEIFIDFGICESDKNKIGEHLRDIYRGRSTDPAGLLTKEVVWDLWYDQTRVASARRCVV